MLFISVAHATQMTANVLTFYTLKNDRKTTELIFIIVFVYYGSVYYNNLQITHGCV